MRVGKWRWSLMVFSFLLVAFFFFTTASSWAGGVLVSILSKGSFVPLIAEAGAGKTSPAKGKSKDDSGKQKGMEKTAQAAVDDATPAVQPAVRALHGGRITRTSEHALEVLCASEAVCIYLYDKEGKPTSIADATGEVSLTLADKSRHDVALSYSAPKPPDNHDYLYCSVANIEGDLAEAMLDIRLSNLPGGDARPVGISLKYKPVESGQ